MEQLGVISRIEEPTEWCSGMVVAPKKCKDEVRICVDLSPLNEAVCREKFILPSVDQTLGMLSGAKVFSKIGANMGLWQVPLTKDCAHSTTQHLSPHSDATSSTAYHLASRQRRNTSRTGW